MGFFSTTIKATATAALIFGATAAASFAQEIKFFTIGTGGTGATYYPVGGVIANAISNPPGSRPCDEGGSCGVPGLIASAVSSRGSVDNVNAIVSGLRDSGFAQSDVASWAYTGTGTMEGKPPATDLRSHRGAVRRAHPPDRAARTAASIRWPISRASAFRSTSRARAPTCRRQADP